MPPCSAKGDRPSTMSLDPDHPKLSWRSLELGMKYLWKQNYYFEEYLWYIWEISVKAKLSLWRVFVEYLWNLWNICESKIYPFEEANCIVIFSPCAPYTHQANESWHLRKNRSQNFFVGRIRWIIRPIRAGSGNCRLALQIDKVH